MERSGSETFDLGRWGFIKVLFISSFSTFKPGNAISISDVSFAAFSIYFLRINSKSSNKQICAYVLHDALVSRRKIKMRNIFLITR